MTITERIIKILMNANTLRINFWFNGINGNFVLVQGPQFIMVAENIKTNNISIVEGNAKSGEAVYTARNDGNRLANTLYIGKNDYSSTSFEALIVHEAVHAIYDLSRSVIPWLDNETAAYIAQGFYANNAGIPDNKVHAGDFIYLGKMIANDIIAGKQIDDFWMNEIRDKLRNDPIYAPYINQNFVGDG